MANRWLAHVKATLRSHKGLKFSQVLKLAKKTYKKKGGNLDESSPPTSPTADTAVEAGRRRRKGRKTARRTRRR